ncbi:MAG: PTS glucose transporter subunit IIA [Anaerococcus vaginalis]|uniref:PTS sugar transporter subunit IIA n=1 Tax=Anaerococcus jeddahensis TaxID=1673719 RepID=UPI000672704F|nr:PTS glucose transporter subunit IIA [Anaerococcus jeddahensis]MDU5912765.1 PTS glucose transporter subunit IIA [Anaerococcus vaginalis]
MFDFFKKKNKVEKKVSIASPVNGKVVKLEEVPDPVFAEKMVGDGFAVLPEDGEVYSPVDGEVTLQPDGYHAIGIKTDEGIEVLVHFGLETVELKGEGFTPHVKVGDKVNKGDKVLSVDIEKIKDKVPSIITPCIVANLEKNILSEINFGAKCGEEVQTVTIVD